MPMRSKNSSMLFLGITGCTIGEDAVLNADALEVDIEYRTHRRAIQHVAVVDDLRHGRKKEKEVACITCLDRRASFHCHP
jgi:DeoR/GlpR family transcriptional regulator of sugar metabolism